MCYAVAKKFNDIGCVTLKCTHGKEYAEWKSSLAKRIGYDVIQLVTISNPEAYGEYAPYRFVETREEFEKEVLNMLN